MEEVERQMALDLGDMTPFFSDTTTVFLTMPEFDVKANYRFAQSGTLAFLSVNTAQYKGISYEPGFGIDALAQEVTIRINRYGTTAATTTVTHLVGAPGGPITLDFNRPFLFLIVEKRSESVLFAGRIEKPGPLRPGLCRSVYPEDIGYLKHLFPLLSQK